MVFAVVGNHAHILQWESCNDAFTHHLPDSLLDCGNVLRRDRTTHNLVDEFEPGSPIERFDSHVDLTELTGTPRLFFVTMMAIGLPCHRLSVRDARHTSFALDSIA